MAIKISGVKAINFDRKTLHAEFQITFSKDGRLNSIIKTFPLKGPVRIVSDIVYTIKSKDRLIIDDPTLDPVEKLNFYSPIIIENLEQTEEKLLNYFSELCKQAAKLSKIKDAKEHLRILDQLKTTSLVL